MTGKIAMVRYGGNFRGLKVKAAQDAGAAGVLIYSDPAEDGDSKLDTLLSRRIRETTAGVAKLHICRSHRREWICSLSRRSSKATFLSAARIRPVPLSLPW